MAVEPADPSTDGELSETERMVQQAMAEAQSAMSRLQDEASEQSEDEVGARSHSLPGFDTGAASDASSDIDLLGDVDLNVMVELGRTEMLVEDVLRLAAGSVVELDKLAGDPVDVYVNQQLVARGEVLVLNDNFCIRISEILDTLQDATPDPAVNATAPDDS
ncbi:MAG: flagellar motor switch protein FliN [Phycisphaeraceae bacterium]|nr:flagellar motor switch protein FliN [Phycisphaeraceae bacterium]